MCAHAQCRAAKPRRGHGKPAPPIAARRAQNQKPPHRLVTTAAVPGPRAEASPELAADGSSFPASPQPACASGRPAGGQHAVSASRTHSRAEEILAVASVHKRRSLFFAKTTSFSLASQLLKFVFVGSQQVRADVRVGMGICTGINHCLRSCTGFCGGLSDMV